MVTALTLGCSIDYVEASREMASIGWNLETASTNDANLVCGAGFEMEIILGRLYDVAWKGSSGDRTLLQLTYADRTGIAMEAAEVDKEFKLGAASSRAILQHAVAREAIDTLAEALSDAHYKDKGRIEGSRLEAVAALITGVRIA